jgi:hypothetical protein
MTSDTAAERHHRRSGDQEIRRESGWLAATLLQLSDLPPGLLIS